MTFWFQSLFYWKLFWKYALFLTILCRFQFQSLFYWKLFWKASKLEFEFLSFSSFNPYSTGSYSGRFYLHHCPKEYLCVSILILLEVILEVVFTLTFPPAATSFNPYSTGSYSGRMPVITRAVTDNASFNPYSTGSYSGSRIGSRKFESYRSFNPYSTGSYSGS